MGHLLQKENFALVCDYMESVSESAKTVLLYAGDLLLFVVVSVLFLPAFLIVTVMQPLWSKKLGDLFGL